MSVNIALLQRKHEDRRENDRHDMEAALRACGWSCSSNYPGSYWLWSKSFPESKTQSRLQRDGSRTPYPPLTVNCASFETAINIEASWQQLFDDTKEFRLPDDEDD